MLILVPSLTAWPVGNLFQRRQEMLSNIINDELHDDRCNFEKLSRWIETCHQYKIDTFHSSRDCQNFMIRTSRDLVNKRNIAFVICMINDYYQFLGGDDQILKAYEAEFNKQFAQSLQLSFTIKVTLQSKLC